MTFLLAFAVFALAFAGLAVGVMCGRRPLRGSCGGAGDAAAGDDCLCARKANDLCASDEGNELVVLAELGYPRRKDYFAAARGASPAGGAAPGIEV